MHIEPGLLPLLEPGEQVIAVESVGPTTSQGAERNIPVGQKQPRAPRQSVGETVSDLAWGNWMPRWARGDLTDRMFGGVARQGVPGSSGAALFDAARRDTAVFVVTDRRVFVARQGSLTFVDDPEHPGRRTADHEHTLVWSAPRAAVQSARRRGRINGRGRVEVYFRDQSMCALVTGLLATRAAMRLVTALPS